MEDFEYQTKEIEFYHAGQLSSAMRHVKITQGDVNRSWDADCLSPFKLL